MSRIVAGLKRSGLAKIDADPRDARRIQVSATPKGERLLQEARDRRIQLLAELLDQVSGREAEVLRAATEIIEVAMRRVGK